MVASDLLLQNNVIRQILVLLFPSRYILWQCYVWTEAGCRVRFLIVAGPYKDRQCGMSSAATLVILHVISFPISLPKHYVQIILYKNLKNVLKKNYVIHIKKINIYSIYYTIACKVNQTFNTEWHKKKGTFEKPNKNWRNPRKKIYWQKLNHYNLPFKRQ